MGQDFLLLFSTANPDFHQENRLWHAHCWSRHAPSAHTPTPRTAWRRPRSSMLRAAGDKNHDRKLLVLGRLLAIGNGPTMACLEADSDLKGQQTPGNCPGARL